MGLLAAAGCGLISGLSDYERIDGDAPRGTPGGLGGTSTSGGGQEGTAGQGGTGGASLALGSPCSIPTQCGSGFCVDGVCCDTACTTTCQACSAATNDIGVDGTCTNTAPGLDPHADCEDKGSLGCKKDGTCDGAGACRLYLAGTPCGALASCQGGEAIHPDQCDGYGECVIGGAQLCGSYRCDAQGRACRASCTTLADCTAGAYCNAINECIPQKLQGQPCSAAVGGECATGHCVDGVCCNEPCGEACRTCSAAKKGSGLNGTCGNVLTDTDPDAECLNYTCNTGACHTTCSSNSQCDDGATCIGSRCE
ncbi:hypothetical protein [Chondromyces crocatus]|nr:hypothetical protein [Chondromyces crocatus]